jgi:formyltetrahydrofolate-dependent phosphoribosylglycinamide formyltransferase
MTTPLSVNSVSAADPQITSNGQNVKPIPVAFPVIGRPVRLAVLLSGGGTTLLNFVDQIQRGSLDAEIPLVISSQRTCRGADRARSAGLRCEVIRPRDFTTVEQFSDSVFDVIRAAGIDFVAMAGFLSLLHIPEDYSLRVVNIHPSLIPAFCGRGYYGHHVHEAAVARGVKVSGCTVHFADNHYDHGPIILQRSVSVPDDADADRLAELVFEEEKIAYPEAIRLLASGKLVLQGHRVIRTGI